MTENEKNEVHLKKIMKKLEQLTPKEIEELEELAKQLPTKKIKHPSEIVSIPELSAELLTEAKEREEKYIDKVEKAKGFDIFKYLLLLDSTAIKRYVALTRLQAEQSFKLSKYVALAGFVLISIGIALGIASSFIGTTGLNAAYLTAIAGMLSEFISGVFFYLYNRTLQQINLFYDRMLMTKHVVMSFLSNSLIEDATKRQETQAELSKMLMSSSAKT